MNQTAQSAHIEEMQKGFTNKPLRAGLDTHARQHMVSGQVNQVIPQAAERINR